MYCFVLDARETGKQEQTAVLLTLLPQTLSSSVLKVTLLQIPKAEVHNLGSNKIEQFGLLERRLSWEEQLHNWEDLSSNPSIY